MNPFWSVAGDLSLSMGRQRFIERNGDQPPINLLDAAAVFLLHVKSPNRTAACALKTIRQNKAGVICWLEIKQFVVVWESQCGKASLGKNRGKAYAPSAWLLPRHHLRILM